MDKWIYSTLCETGWKVFFYWLVLLSVVNPPTWTLLQFYSCNPLKSGFPSSEAHYLQLVLSILFYPGHPVETGKKGAFYLECPVNWLLPAMLFSDHQMALKDSRSDFTIVLSDKALHPLSTIMCASCNAWLGGGECESVKSTKKYVWKKEIRLNCHFFLYLIILVCLYLVF